MKKIKVLVRATCVEFVNADRFKVTPDAISLSTMGERTAFYFRKHRNCDNPNWREQAATALLKSNYSLYVKAWLPVQFVPKRKDKHAEAKAFMKPMF